MKTLKNFFSLFALIATLVVFQNCNNQPTEQNPSSQAEELKELEKATMAAHDVVMPLTGKLPPLWEELDTVRMNTSDEAQKADLQTTIEDLKAAHKAMYDWMDNYKQLRLKLENAPADSVKIWLTHEKEVIEQVKIMTDVSYQKGQQLLEILKN